MIASPDSPALPLAPLRAAPIVSPPGKGPLLVVPLVEKGKGGGHAARCAALVRDARALGREAFLFPCGPLDPESPLPGQGPALAPLLAGIDPSWIVDSPGGKRWDLIVLDRLQTSRREYGFWSSLGPLIGIDEGGPCRDRFDFLIDLLPGLPGRPPPNILDPGLLPLPRNRRPPDREPAGPLKVLISFGAEDHAGLGGKCAAALCSPPVRGRDFHITLINPQGRREGEGELWGNLTVLRTLPSLGERLAEYDLLITHFGLTAFEALHAGVPVLLVSPSAYHQRLARAAGFLSAGFGASALRRIRKLASRDWRDLREHCSSLARRHDVAREGGPRLADLIDALRPEFLNPRCPCCGDSGGALHPVAARFPRRIFRRCPRCGAFAMGRLDAPPIEYGKEYFFELYRKQYGKTYIEDFPNLSAMAERRLRCILPLLGRLPKRCSGEGGPRLLDIGCAYGAFLQAASRTGFKVLGLEPAEDAASYVRDTLKLPAIRSFFPPAGNEKGEGNSTTTTNEYSLASGSFSVVTLWYVIEHFRDPAAALGEIRRLLKDGGVLAFSTPSFSGISGRTSLRTFLDKSPGDHWTLWSPRICRRVLKFHGFRLKKIVATGSHPERFPLLGRICGTRGPLYRLLFLLSRIFRLGDTFEVYAIKEPLKGRGGPCPDG